MHLRRARRDDVPAVMDLVRRVVPAMQAAGNYQWDDLYPNPEVFLDDVAHQHLWLAQIETSTDTSTDRPARGSIAGVAAFTTHQDAEYAGVGWDLTEPALVIHRLAVDPAYRGQGFARTLMLEAEAEARRRGVRVIRLDTNTSNIATQNLFPKLGYRFAGEINLAHRPGLRFRCYEKRLDDPPPQTSTPQP